MPIDKELKTFLAGQADPFFQAVWSLMQWAYGRALTRAEFQALEELLDNGEEPKRTSQLAKVVDVALGKNEGYELWLDRLLRVGTPSAGLSLLRESGLRSRIINEWRRLALSGQADQLSSFVTFATSRLEPNLNVLLKEAVTPEEDLSSRSQFQAWLDGLLKRGTIATREGEKPLPPTMAEFLSGSLEDFRKQWVRSGSGLSFQDYLVQVVEPQVPTFFSRFQQASAQPLDDLEREFNRQLGARGLLTDRSSPGYVELLLSILGDAQREFKSQSRVSALGIGPAPDIQALINQSLQGVIAEPELRAQLGVPPGAPISVASTQVAQRVGPPRLTPEIAEAQIARQERGQPIELPPEGRLTPEQEDEARKAIEEQRGFPALRQLTKEGGPPGPGIGNTFTAGNALGELKALGLSEGIDQILSRLRSEGETEDFLSTVTESLLRMAKGESARRLKALQDFGLSLAPDQAGLQGQIIKAAGGLPELTRPRTEDFLTFADEEIQRLRRSQQKSSPVTRSQFPELFTRVIS